MLGVRGGGEGDRREGRWKETAEGEGWAANEDQRKLLLMARLVCNFVQI